MNVATFLNTSSDLPVANVWTVDKIIIDFFNSLGPWGNFALIAISLVLTILLVGVIGFEREYRGHNAGLRTHVLVALGSAIIMVVSMYSIGYGANMETMRLAATVCTGIGFLGAGVIIQTGTTVKGLTTAATLWMSMSIGLACGSGNFMIAILGTLLAIICLIAFIPLEKLANKRNPIIYVSVPVNTSPVKEILTIATKYGISVNNFESFITSYDGQDAIRMVIKINKVKKPELTDFVDEIQRKIEIYEIKVA
jgi:putative Mg2+ transporter-C (MgtC) family protein